MLHSRNCPCLGCQVLRSTHEAADKNKKASHDKDCDCEPCTAKRLRLSLYGPAVYRTSGRVEGAWAKPQTKPPVDEVATYCEVWGLQQRPRGYAEWREEYTRTGQRLPYDEMIKCITVNTVVNPSRAYPKPKSERSPQELSRIGSIPPLALLMSSAAALVESIITPDSALLFYSLLCMVFCLGWAGAHFVNKRYTQE